MIFEMIIKKEEKRIGISAPWLFEIIILSHNYNLFGST